ncbi:hypothetical protein [Limobrevibacterium gyesilva]|uniref:Lipoprotein n=1 Tax=Limobrevibacterium gyesilva TaxID=2991712 RepID=A0AA42CH53_9PROT|nr:hypothetical protein [Limobrevibacterium gyesilva]MCW3474485.1 hypothetical protein [Limobrevibacterium gyesilva]
MQLDKTGTLLGTPWAFACPRSGCQEFLDFYVAGKARRFLAAFTFVPKGAYIAVQSMTPELRQVVEFEKGFEGPIFVLVRDANTVAQTLRFTLTGSAMAESDQERTQLMNTDRSLVFQRKLEPDLTLKVELTPPPPAG